MSVNNLDLYRKSKAHLKNLEKLLKVINVTLLSLQEYKLYKPANECSSYLNVQRLKLENIIQELERIKTNKGQVD